MSCEARPLDARKTRSEYPPPLRDTARQPSRDAALRCAAGRLAIVVFALAAFFTTPAVSAQESPSPRHHGPAFDRHGLTLGEGWREELFGPFFQRTRSGSQHQWAVPPLLSWTADPEVEMAEFDFLYPLFTYDRFGAESKVQLLQLLALNTGGTQSGGTNSRFAIFPLYFHQRSPDPAKNYTALTPLGGTIRDRLFRDEIQFALFPLWARTRKREVVTHNYLYPVFHLRKGPALRGWQVWPLVGHEEKKPHHFKNRFGDEELAPGHERDFLLWPFFLSQTTGLGTDNVERQRSILPLFSLQRSPQRDSLTAPWPLGLTLIEDRARKYRELGLPWPFIVFARGEGKQTTRVWPLYSHTQSGALHNDFVLWPLWTRRQIHTEGFDRDRRRVLYFLHNDTVEINRSTGASRRRTDFWPFFTRREELDGSARLQILAPLEPLLPGSKSIERNYSPLWSLWRSERNGKTGAASQSLLWNLWRRERTTAVERRSFFFGLWQSETTAQGTRHAFFRAP